MQTSYGSSPSALRTRSTVSRAYLTPASSGRCTIRAAGVVCKATTHREQGKRFDIKLPPKLNAALLATLPLITALPAGANEIQHYLQLATPGLAIVIGSLAYAAAAPPAFKQRLLSKTPPLENVSLDQILQTEYHPCPGASPVPSKLEQLVEEMASETAAQPVQIPVQTVMAAESSPVVAELTMRETDAHSLTLAEEALVPLSTQAKEIAEGRGRMMLMGFADKHGRTGKLSQGAAEELATSALKGNGAPLAVHALQEEDPGEKAKEIVSYVMEWTGLDARESQRALAEGNVKSNVVPLHKSGENATRELVALTSASQGGRDNGTTDGGELATVAMLATVPTSAVAALADTPVKSDAQLRTEHKEKIESLMSQVSSIKAVAVAPIASPQASQQKDYDAKVSALKHSAADKQKAEESRLHQQRAQLESKLNQATKDRLQAVQPYSALAKTNKPQGLAKLHPKALIASIVDTMMAFWRIFVRTARRITGQDPPSPQMQT